MLNLSGGIFIYNFTRTEKWITNKYLMYNIKYASDLTLENLSTLFNTTVYKFPMSARYDVFNEQRFIAVDSRCPPQVQQEQFYHELCHVLFHGGHQSNMYDLYRKLLEWEANNFVMYAALPYYLLKEYDLSCDNIIYILSTDFGVTKQLCEKRLFQVKSRMLTNIGMVAESNISYY